MILAKSMIMLLFMQNMNGILDNVLNSHQQLHFMRTSPVQKNTTSPGTEEAIAIKKLGKNHLAQLAAWVSLFCSSALGISLSYTTLEQVCEKALLQLYVGKEITQSAAQLMSMIVIVPTSLVALIKGAPLGWYFYYVLFAGERVSPLLAQTVLRDLSAYIHHLHVIKDVQKELLSIIHQINQDVNVDAAPTKNYAYSNGQVDPALLYILEEAIAHDEVYIQEIVAQLYQFLSAEEIHNYMHDQNMVFYNQQSGKDVQNISVTSDVQLQVQNIAHALQDYDVDLGYYAIALNKLICDLIIYWQRYTTGLAEGIDNSLQFCQNVYFVEQIIINWLDRPLLST